MKKANSVPSLAQACPQWAEKLSAIHRDDLSFAECMELRNHLETCVRCQSVKAEYRALDALITGLPPVAPLAEMPARLRELTGMRDKKRVERELASTHLLADDTHEGPPSSRQTHMKQRLVALNMAAAVLVVAAIVAGFLALRVSHPSGPGSQGTNPLRPQTPIQHPAYLDVIIGNAHGDTYAVDPQNGDVAWKSQVMVAPNSSPFAANGVFCITLAPIMCYTPWMAAVVNASGIASLLRASRVIRLAGGSWPRVT
jgi:hypothetical protein